MKKFLPVLILALVLALCGSALASSVQLGSTGLSLTLPSGYESDTLTSDDKANDMIGYWYGDDLDLAVYYTNTNGYSLDDMVDYYKGDSDFLDAGYVDGTIGGQKFVYCTYKETENGQTYYCVMYITLVDGKELDLCFYMDSLDDKSSAEKILRTLNGGTTAGSESISADEDEDDDADYTDTATVQTVPGTSLSYTLPQGFASDELTSEDTADGMVQYWYSSTLGIAVYVEDADGYTVEDLDSEMGSDSSFTQHGTTTMPCGQTFAYGVYSVTDSGETYTVVEYATVLDSKLVSLVFEMKSNAEYIGSSEAADIMNSLTLN